MVEFVVVHGAWSGGWAWNRMPPLMARQGHAMRTPTLTGLGDRVHLATPDVGLETHIRDILALLDMEDLRDIVLLAHSYGGMVATGVADRAAERIARVIYLDAFVPRDGDSLAMLSDPAGGGAASMAANAIDGWKIPPRDMPPDTSEADRAWATPRRKPQPIRAFDSPLRLARGEPQMPRHYIYCRRPNPGDVFRQFHERALREPGWTAHTIDASHSPNITAPDRLAALLTEIVRD